MDGVAWGILDIGYHTVSDPSTAREYTPQMKP